MKRFLALLALLFVTCTHEALAQSYSPAGGIPTPVSVANGGTGDSWGGETLSGLAIISTNGDVVSDNPSIHNWVCTAALQLVMPGQDQGSPYNDYRHAYFRVSNVSASGNVTLVARNANTFNGQSSYILRPGRTVLLFSGEASDWKVFETGSTDRGTATLSSGTATVTAPGVTANSIFTAIPHGSGSGVLNIGTITAGTSFVINSSDATDARSVDWSITLP